MHFELKAFRPSEGVTLLKLTAPSLAETTRQAEGRGTR
jgi:hypothetical protein